MSNCQVDVVQGQQKTADLNKIQCSPSVCQNCLSEVAMLVAEEQLNLIVKSEQALSDIES